MLRYVILLIIILFTGLLIQASAATPAIDRWRAPIAIATSLSILCQQSINPQARPILLGIARRDLDYWQPDSGLEGIKAELRQNLERLQAARGYEAGMVACATVMVSIESIRGQARQDGLTAGDMGRIFDGWQSE